jgi:sulfoxide reductase catalytic subunit YedY
LRAESAKELYPAKQNLDFTLDRPVTPEATATGYNNFYEFHPTDKSAVKENAGEFRTSPWSIEIKGLVKRPLTADLDDLLKKMPLEERLYRFRCVEAWSLAVPWTGFPLSALIDLVEPKSEAAFLRFVTVSRPKEMPGMKMAPRYPWPFCEGLRMDEARNPLAMVVTGIYGKPLPPQCGAPIRIVAPWKYGYKSPKSIAVIEFVADQPSTFWNTTTPGEYGFYSNVNPAKPHPRWSQASERVLASKDRRPTLPYNGYEKWVAGMYNGDEF